MYTLDEAARQTGHTVTSDDKPARPTSLSVAGRLSVKTTSPEPAMTDAAQRPICIFFAMGGCIRGSRCPFSHELRQEAPAGVDVSAGYFITGKVANYRSGTSIAAGQLGGAAEAMSAVPPSTLTSNDETGQSSCGSIGPSLASSPTVTTSAPPTTRLAAPAMRTEGGNLPGCQSLPQTSLCDGAQIYSPQARPFSLATGAAAPAATSSAAVTAARMMMTMTDFGSDRARSCGGDGAAAPPHGPTSVMSTVSGVRLASVSDALQCRSDGSQLSLQEHAGRGSFIGSLPVSDDVQGIASMETTYGQSMTSDPAHIALGRTPPQLVSHLPPSSTLTPPGTAGELTGATVRVAAAETMGKYEPRYTLRQSAFHTDDAVMHSGEQPGRTMTTATRVVVANCADDMRRATQDGGSGVVPAELSQQGSRAAWLMGGGGVHVPANAQRPASAPDLAASVEEATPLSVVVRPAISRLAAPQPHLDARYTASSQQFAASTTQLGRMPSDAGVHPAQLPTHSVAGVQPYVALNGDVHTSSVLHGRLGVGPQPQQPVTQHQAAGHIAEVYVGTRPTTNAAQQQHQHGPVATSATHAQVPLNAPQRGGGTTHIQVPAPRTRMVQQRLQQQQQQQQSRQDSATHFVAPQPRSKMISTNKSASYKPPSAATRTTTTQSTMHSAASANVVGATHGTSCAGYYIPTTSPRQSERVAYSNSPETAGLRPSVTMAGSKPSGAWGGPRSERAAVPTDTTLTVRQEDIPRFASTMSVSNPALLSAVAAQQQQQRLGGSVTQPAMQSQGHVALSQVMLPASQLLFRRAASGEQETGMTKSVRTLALQPQHGMRDGEAAATSAVLRPMSSQEGGAALQPFAAGSAGGGLVPVVLLTNGNSLFASGLSGADGMTYAPVKTYMGGNFVLVSHASSLGGSSGTLVGTVAQQ